MAQSNNENDNMNMFISYRAQKRLKTMNELSNMKGKQEVKTISKKDDHIGLVFFTHISAAHEN